jgi:hypothetical protein
MTLQPARALAGAAAIVLLSAATPPCRASDTPDPGSVTVAGSLQSELGCPGDWQPDCASSHLAFDAIDGVWQGTFAVPGGNWEYKAALGDSWVENYGANATRSGSNITLSLASAASVKFYYDHESHWIADDHDQIIATAAGSFQSELGCPGDWQPDCLRSWLEDPDGDGVYSFVASLPPGNYEVKVAHNESWSENYGAGGVQNGANIAFTVQTGCERTSFVYNPTTHVLTVSPAPALGPQPTRVTVAGSLQSELGCPGDWQPDCAATHLALDTNDGVWQGTFPVPAGAWEYRAALDDAWAENYGQNASPGGANIGLTLPTPASVTFYYDHGTHWIADSVNKVIATAAGSFQSELGCPGDWQPGCLRSWLEDPDGDGIYSFIAVIPAGEYEVEVAHDEGLGATYGLGGLEDGPSIAFTAPGNCTPLRFTYNPATHLLTVAQASASQPTTTFVASSRNPSLLGEVVTLTATVDPPGATGTIRFYADATLLGAATLSGGTATHAAAGLAAGVYPITAVYAGDATYLPSTSPPLLLQVIEPVPVLGVAGLLVLFSLITAFGVVRLRP